jgi:vacuolar-type H+-ATPase subunit C/Vma6
MHDYGSARIAGRRARLLPPDVLARLAAAGSADEMLLMLERIESWRGILRDLGPLVSPARAGIELAIERHRSACLADLPAFFPAPARALVEALVLPLDLERLLEVLRRRRAGEPAEAVARGVSRGALLDDVTLGAIARASDSATVARLLVRHGVLVREDAAALAAHRNEGADAEALERDVAIAFDAARRRRAAAGPREAGALVSGQLDAERDEAAAVDAELRSNGADAATDLERQLRLARLDRRAARARRDPLGIGVAIGYVAAVEAETIRLRAALAAVSSGWSRERAGAWLAAGAAR